MHQYWLLCRIRKDSNFWVMFRCSFPYCKRNFSSAAFFLFSSPLQPQGIRDVIKYYFINLKDHPCQITMPLVSLFLLSTAAELATGAFVQPPERTVIQYNANAVCVEAFLVGAHGETSLSSNLLSNLIVIMTLIPAHTCTKLLAFSTVVYRWRDFFGLQHLHFQTQEFQNNFRHDQLRKRGIHSAKIQIAANLVA